ncbi:helix-turn-helix domain-containing protein [Clostridium estertheticum]|uniref:helix-turn-helix domain-containing protein n=1 Tax=Clostridium estertheticum TaxID=238834 RepID=UPI001CC97729|nr:helix-turn-helix transcriptional regulator [Clostridium estertheticum]MBZ9615336.1 helix-turn-helix domain-containing protein [Clostridium estertheticum subsp. laramiense]WAG75225.1 helix-turn-helix domain-containing protein [Clostridium estertheticum]
MAIGKTELIKNLIKVTGLSVKAFSKKADLPYSTLRSMLERGIGNASVNNVIKVCKTLGIKVEQLDEMAENENCQINEEPKSQLETIAAHFDGEEFTEDDKDDIENFIKYVISKKNK